MNFIFTKGILQDFPVMKILRFTSTAANEGDSRCMARHQNRNLFLTAERLLPRWREFSVEAFNGRKNNPSGNCGGCQGERCHSVKSSQWHRPGESRRGEASALGGGQIARQTAARRQEPDGLLFAGEPVYASPVSCTRVNGIAGVRHRTRKSRVVLSVSLWGKPSCRRDSPAAAGGPARKR